MIRTPAANAAPRTLRSSGVSETQVRPDASAGEDQHHQHEEVGGENLRNECPVASPEQRDSDSKRTPADCPGDVGDRDRPKPHLPEEHRTRRDTRRPDQQARRKSVRTSMSSGVSMKSAHADATASVSA